jgi:TrmH family RNA methyltransferase
MNHDMGAVQRLQQITVILDRPSHPGNIGATARAMKNMGLSHLRLIAPRLFPHPEAVDFAAGAADILDHVEVFDDLPAAVADIHILVATSNRPRKQRKTILTPEELGARCPGLLQDPRVRMGLLFGTERSGLETEDIERADLLCHIPTAGTYSSLNLSQAVMIVAYELLRGTGLGDSFAHDPLTQGVPATADQMERLFQHMESVLKEIDFVKSGQHRHMMGSMKAIFHRAGLDRREVAILRGILHEIVASRERAGLDRLNHEDKNPESGLHDP